MQNKINTKKSGYTIIETMIAVSLFVVIITTGVGALLNANLLHQKSRDMRSIMDNLSFILEDMSRNLRTGWNYECISDEESIPALPPSPTSCPYGIGVYFQSSLGRWAYHIDTNPSDINKLSVFKSVDESGAMIQYLLTPEEVDIDPVSGFSVLGAEPPSGDEQQPFVIIRLVGTLTFKDTITPFSLQTSVSQRLLDI